MSEAVGDADAAGADTTKDPTPPPRSLPGSFSPADIRLLVITVAATIMANLATAVMIGLAIAAARHFKHDNLGTVGWVVLVATPLGASFYWLDRKGEKDRRGRRWLLAVYAPLMVFAVLAILVWVGLASGITG
jgi:uncharacterized membrane protein